MNAICSKYAEYLKKYGVICRYYVIIPKMLDQITLKILEQSDVTSAYVSWLSDPQVVRFSDNQYRNVSVESQKKFVQSCIDSSYIILWGIFFENLHIGNVALDNINFNHLRAEVTYILGDTNYWGRGIATYAVKFIIAYARKELALRKLYAGVAEENIASIKVLQKCGFLQEAKRESHLYYNNTWMAQLDYKLMLR